MQTKQTIAVIGNIEGWGTEVYKNISVGNYRILFPGNDTRASDKLIEEIKSGNSLADIESINCLINACWEADIIITALAFENSPGSNIKLQRVACQKTVIVVINDGAEITNGQNGILLAANARELLPYSKIIFAMIKNGSPKNGLIVLQNDSGNSDRYALESAAEVLGLAGFSIKEAEKINH